MRYGTCLLPCAIWPGPACPWRYLPGDFPTWPAVYQQLRRWLEVRCFESMVDDWRHPLRPAPGRPADPSAILLDRRTLQSTPESGHRAGYDGATRRKGSKVHVAVDTLGHLLAAVVTPGPTNRTGRRSVHWRKNCKWHRDKMLR